jgi:hypothetical protein
LAWVSTAAPGDDCSNRWRATSPELAPDVFGPLLRVPSHPLLMASFGAKALVPATALARR